MKIAIVTDTHWGVRNDNQIFADYISSFYKNQFFPKIDELGITTVFHLGDVVDRRKYINYVTAKRLEDDFIKPCADRNIQLYMIAGNHDTFYKNTNEVNSIRQLYANSTYSNMHLYWDEPIELEFDGCKIMLAPWICADNQDKTFNAFKNTTAQILMGHFEIMGFEMDKGHICEGGIDRKLFTKFDQVYSGHFHQRSTIGNISYIGSPYEMTWADYDQDRGFNVFDTETREMTFYKNNTHMFHKVWYDDRDMTIEDVANLDTSQLTNTHIKVIISNKDHPYIFDLFLDRLTTSGAADIKVVDDHMNMDIIDEEELIDEAQDTMTILRGYIEQLEIKADKKKVENFVSQLYQEAVNL